jgi:hypothetical protein
MVKDRGQVVKREEEVGENFTFWWIKMAIYAVAVFPNGTRKMEVEYPIYLTRYSNPLLH